MDACVLHTSWLLSTMMKTNGQEEALTFFACVTQGEPLMHSAPKFAHVHLKSRQSNQTITNLWCAARHIQGNKEM